MAIQLISSIVAVLQAAVEAEAQRYWEAREAEFNDFSDYYHSQYSDF